MTIYRIQRGRFAGNYDIPRSIKTMEIGEEWHISECASLQTARNNCSITNRVTDMRFKCHSPGIDEPYITIKRIK